jgi:hypothetical protein
MSAIDLKFIRSMLGFIWIVTGILSLGIFPQRESLALLDHVELHGTPALVALYGSASMDILLGVLTLTHPSKLLWRSQAALVVAYSAIIAIYLPIYWLHPFGPILKNLPILLFLWFLDKYQENKS